LTKTEITGFFAACFNRKKVCLLPPEMVVMKNEGREPTQDNNGRPNNRPMEERASEQRDRRGPFTRTAGWLGIAFDRTQISQREAQERRSRNM
jgi:hypothetical protein